MLSGDAGLVQRSSVDQIADRFGLRKIDAAIEVRAQGELAGLSKASAGDAGSLESVLIGGRRYATRRGLERIAEDGVS